MSKVEAFLMILLNDFLTVYTPQYLRSFAKVRRIHLMLDTGFANAKPMAVELNARLHGHDGGWRHWNRAYTKILRVDSSR